MRVFLAMFFASAVAALGQPAGPPPASQTEVNAGVVAKKYISPKTLSGWTGGTNSGIFTTEISYADRTNGNNATAILGRIDKASSTISNAVRLVGSRSGSVVYVRPGTYNENNLLTNGVNYYFMPGATVFYRQSLTNNGTESYGIFDDRGCGATTNIIAGGGDFWYQTYTGSVAKATELNLINLNTHGCIVLSNASTDFRITGNSASLVNYLNVSRPGIISVYNCAYSSFNFKNIFDPRTTGNFSNRLTQANYTVAASSSSTSGIYWQTGPMYCNIGLNDPLGYGIWADVANPTPTDLWYNGSKMTGKIYINATGVTNNDYRAWVNLDTLEKATDNTGDSTMLSVWGNGKYYLNIKKVESLGVAGPIVMDTPASTTYDNGYIWFNFQKIASSNQWFNLLGPTKVYATGLQMTDTGGVNNGIRLAGSAELYLDVASPIIVSNGTAVFHSGANLELRNVTLDTSRGAGTTNYPVFLGGGMGQFKMKGGGTLIAPAATPAIFATNAQNAGIYGAVMSNRTNSPNVTLTPLGVFTIDPTVQ